MGLAPDCIQDVLCRLRLIEGLESEHDLALRDLTQHSSLERCIWFSRCWSLPSSCLYGQTNFKWESDDLYNWKLCCPVAPFLEKGALRRLIEMQRIGAVISRDRELMGAFAAQLARSARPPMFHVVTEDCGGECAGETVTILSRMRKILGPFNQ